MNDDEKIKYALEELNRWHIQLNNSFWIVSSFFMSGTLYFLNEIVPKSLKEDNQILKLFDSGTIDNILVIFVLLLIILIWYFYLGYVEDTLIKAAVMYKKINSYEILFNFDILPNPELLKRIRKKCKSVKRIEFARFMIYISCLVFFLCLMLIILNIYYVIK